MNIDSIAQLEDMLSEPRDYVIDALGKLDGDILILGAGGKMGPSLARMARRASDLAGNGRRVIAVSRFSSQSARSLLEESGIETIPCDLLDETAVLALPDAPNVVYMAGMKFGTSERQSATWVMNAYLPGVICRKYRGSRIAAFSTGNVYGIVPVDSGGSVETDLPDPRGEYAMSTLGRERVFEYFSEAFDIPVALIRLNYASEMRYGVLVDIARNVWRGDPVDVSMGHLNAIWQGDANAMSLAALACASVPPLVLNVAGREILSVRLLAQRFGELMGKPVTITGTEQPDALLSNAGKAFGLFGPPEIDEDQIIEWTADWVTRGGESLDKPTHFETRDGRY